MDIETMPHAMYFNGDSDTVTKINQVPYQTIEYNDNGMFTANLMNDTPIEIFIDKLYLQQFSIPLTVRNNIRILPGKTGVLTLTLQPNKTSFIPRHTIIGKGIAYVKPLDQNLPLRPIEIEFENKHCCIEVYNTSDSTVEFLHG